MADEDVQALALQWVSGLSSDCQGCVLSLSFTGQGDNSRVCYASGHTAVIIDVAQGTQQFLQGHCASISCMVTTPDRRYIITADSGQESLLVVWDSATAEPVQTVSNPHPLGIKAMDVSSKGLMLATIGSSAPETSSQDIAVWSLTCLSEPNTQLQPLAVTAIPAGDVQSWISFSPDSDTELVSNGKRRVYFWEPYGAPQEPGQPEAAACGSFKYYSPPLRAKEFKQTVGDFTCSSFIPGTSQAVTATVDGDVVVWEQQGSGALPGTRPKDRVAIKVMRLHSGPITLLSTSGQHLVTAGEDGYVRFYDCLLRLVAWFEEMKAGPVCSLSFSPPASEGSLVAQEMGQFVAPDFVVGTAQGKIMSIHSDSFNVYLLEKRAGILLKESVAPGVVDVAACPVRQELLVLSAAGTLQRWAFSEAGCQVVCRGQLSKGLQGSAMAVSRDGLLLAVGCSGGHLELLSAQGLVPQHSARNTPHAITKVAVAAAGDLVAVADAGQRTLMYGHLPNKHGHMQWELIGKCKAHHGEVAALMFGLSPAGATRLFSVGADRRLAEYDLAASSPGTGLVLGNLQELMPEACADVPTAACFAPPLPYYVHSSNETLLLIADSGNKVRLHSPDSNTTLCVVAAPECGGSITRLKVFRPRGSGNLSQAPSYLFATGQPPPPAAAPNETEDSKDAALNSLVAFSASNRAAGLMAWPLDGHPGRCSALIAHPGRVTGLTVSADGRSMITAGADGSVNAWAVQPQHLEPALPPEGGARGQAARWAAVLADPVLVSELRDYFDYAQVRIQGEEFSLPRRLNGRVPAAIVPDLMRAAGHYLSQGEAELVVNHLHFLAHSRPGSAGSQPQEHGGGSAGTSVAAGTDMVDFAAFLEVFVNHRPSAGRGQVTLAQLEEAFQQLAEEGVGTMAGDAVTREALIQLLQSKGEALSEDELHVALAALTGAPEPLQALPQLVGTQEFCSHVLGLAAAEDE